jgi:hypothetical protein
MMCCSSDEIIYGIINTLTFEEYVLIDCLKFYQTETKSYHSRLRTFDFIALTEKGFLKIFGELSAMFTEKYALQLASDKIMFFAENILLVIRYTNKDIKDLINLPGLDFFKCYYDGVKIHSTPEAILCHKTKEVQYVGKIKLSLTQSDDCFRYYCLKTENEFWETNKSYIKQVDLESEYYDYFYVKNKKINYHSKTGGSEEVNIDRYQKRIYEFIEKQIFKNPVNTLC